VLSPCASCKHPPGRTRRRLKVQDRDDQFPLSWVRNVSGPNVRFPPAPHKSLTEPSEPGRCRRPGTPRQGTFVNCQLRASPQCTLRGMDFVVLWTPGVNGPTVPQQGPNSGMEML
jgi:hypothetical protein